MSLADWTEGGAEFDVAWRDGIKPTYRHHLWRAKPADLIGRHLVRAGRRLGVCMHNPSKAGAHPGDNDPTMRKVIGFADRWGFSRVDVVNLGDRIGMLQSDFYALVSGGWPVISSVCDQRIREVAHASDAFLVAWGRLGKRWAQERARAVLALIDRQVVCIRVGNGGDPMHPCMEAYTAAPVPFEARNV